MRMYIFHDKYEVFKDSNCPAALLDKHHKQLREQYLQQSHEENIGKEIAAAMGKEFSKMEKYVWKI